MGNEPILHEAASPELYDSEGLTQTPINPGNSGGPLITDDGKLVGVNSFKSAGEGLNFAVSIVDVNAFLQVAGVQQVKRPTNCQTIKMYDGRDSQNIAKLVQYDTNCDGKADYSFVTPDDSAKPITAHIDSNFDGKTDISVEDRDRNGTWDISFHDVDFDGKNDFYVVNGIPFHYDHDKNPIRIRVGDLVRIYLVNVLEFDPINSFHLHANFFHYYPTGTSLTPSEFTDTLALMQGQRGILEFRYKYPGRYMFHAHKTEFAELGWTGVFQVEA